MRNSFQKKLEKIDNHISSFQRKLRGLFFRNHYLGNSFNPGAARKLLKKDTKNPVILEIGGADAKDSIRFCQEFGHNLKLFVFEPDPRHYTVQTNASRDYKYAFLNIAIGQASGEFPFHISSTPYSSSLKSLNTPVLNSEWPGIEFKDSVMVSVMSLDEICRNLDLAHIDLIWADVQGAEIDLIAGAKEALKVTRFLYTEFSPKPYYYGAPNLGEIIEALGHNWRVLRNYGSDVLFQNLEFSNHACL